MNEFKAADRVAGVRDRLASEAFDAVIVTHLENVRYLTGFTGSNGLVILTADRAVFVTDGRYLVQAAQEVPGFERSILPQGSVLARAAGEWIETLGARRVAFEEAHLTVKACSQLREALPASVELVGVSDWVEALRQRKDADELERMRRSIVLVDDCFDHLREFIRPGRTEREIAWEIEVFLRTHGATRLDFESIVASGPNSALPHAHPTDRVVGESGPEFLVCDYGGVRDGYCSDITRTFLVGGEPTERHREVYDAVKRAQQAALDAIRPGRVGKEIDGVARDVLTEAGLGDYFTHSLGHSLGRVTHDGIGFSRTSELILTPGMVLTVEPGAYIEGWGGVRIEDDIVVTETGCEVLTRSTKEMVVLG